MGPVQLQFYLRARLQSGEKAKKVERTEDFAMMIQDAVSQSWAMIQSVIIRKVQSILLMIGCDPRLSLSHGRTTMNDRSSRSHTIFIFKAPCLEFRHTSAKMQAGQQRPEAFRTGVKCKAARGILACALVTCQVEVRDATNGDHMSTMQAEAQDAGRGRSTADPFAPQVVDLAGRENEQTSECKGDRFRELRQAALSLQVQFGGDRLALEAHQSQPFRSG